MSSKRVKYGVDLGFAYKTEVSAKTFTRYIAESQRQNFLQSFSSLNFYSFLMDGSTDVGNVEDELVLIRILDPGDEVMCPVSVTRGVNKS